MDPNLTIAPPAPKEEIPKEALQIQQNRIQLEPAAWAERSFDLNKLYMISQVRESPQPQFDGMGYMKYNETNEQADMSYIAPKKNKMDSRLVAGTTHEKDSSLLSMVQSFNFEGRVRIYYRSEEQYDLGVAFTSWVRASREAENYDVKRPIFYRNLLVQGTSFAQEKFVENYKPRKIINENTVNGRLDQVKWVNAGMQKVDEACISNLVDGKKVFMEDIREPDIQRQPGVYTVEYIPRDYIKSIWGMNPRFKHVPWKTTPMASTGYITQGSMYSDWTFSEIDYTKIEVVQAFRPFENRYQMYLNGVPMLQYGFPLQMISPSGLIPIAKGDLDQMNMFAYSKSIPAKTKVDQAVYDEIIRIMLIKFQQSAFVPRVNNTDMYLSSNILMPGRMNEGFKAIDVEPLITNPGITQSDFKFAEFMSGQLDNKSISSLLEGNEGAGQMTLGQYMDMQKKQMIKLGTIFDAYINWERAQLHLRVMNLIANGARGVKDPKTGKNTYNDVSTDENFGGSQGLHVLKFTDANSAADRTSDDVADEELKYKDETGKAVKYSYINPELLRQIINNPDYTFCYEVVPVDKNNDKLSQALFVSMIAQAANIFGPESLNVAELKKRYADKFGEEFDTLFLDERTLEMKQMQAQQAAMAAETGVPSPISSNVKPTVDAMYA